MDDSDSVQDRPRHPDEKTSKLTASAARVAFIARFLSGEGTQFGF